VVKFPKTMVLDRQAIPHTIGRRGKKRRSSHARTTTLQVRSNGRGHTPNLLPPNEMFQPTSE
jgi:hypothetical protein